MQLYTFFFLFPNKKKGKGLSIFFEAASQISARLQATLPQRQSPHGQMLIQYVHFHIVPLNIFGFAVKLSTQCVRFFFNFYTITGPAI